SPAPVSPARSLQNLHHQFKSGWRLQLCGFISDTQGQSRADGFSRRWRAYGSRRTSGCGFRRGEARRGIGVVDRWSSARPAVILVQRQWEPHSRSAQPYGRTWIQIALAHRDAIQSIGPAFYPPEIVEDWQEAISGRLYLEAM